MVKLFNKLSIPFFYLSGVSSPSASNIVTSGLNNSVSTKPKSNGGSNDAKQSK